MGKKKEWVNPVQGLVDTPDFGIARTMAGLAANRKEELLGDNLIRAKNHLKNYHGWSQEAIEKFLDAVGNMTKADIARAKEYSDAHCDMKAWYKYQEKRTACQTAAREEHKHE
jgi:hypothetical protein